ncbi:ABC transporter permease [Mucilaginibacter calamicampi]|uniref:ABC transporter permease n=1 Tax=Mucilaginibacter calamicampi TaxID=1302352 RepID=A0ABW2YZG9_9SPHI
MINNYIKIAFRTLLKSKVFTAINVFGLALGLATCLLIVFYVFDELSYDKYNVNADRIYRMNNDIKFGGNEGSYATTPAVAAQELKSSFPEVEEVVRLKYGGKMWIRKKNQNIPEIQIVYADPTVFNVFTLPMIEGQPATALKGTHSIVITEKAAQKYFNTINALGKVLTFNDTAFYKVTGVIKNVPQQSHFNYDFFLPMIDFERSRETAWFNNSFHTYVLFKPGTDVKKFEAKMPAFLKDKAEPQLQRILEMTFAKLEQSGSYFRLSLTPLTQIHFNSTIKESLGEPGNITIIYIFSAIALFILLIACVNFMNLSTAQSSSRAREVGVRKVLGSPRKYLVIQFLTESVLVTFAGAMIAVFAAWIFLPVFNQMSGKELTVTPQVVAGLLPLLLVFIIVVGFIAGSYPALFLSGFQPIEVLKGKLAAGFKGGKLRSSLVVFQFAISIFLITATIVIYSQLKYIQNKDIGYSREQVMIVHQTGSLGREKAKMLKHEVEQLAGVKSATLTAFLPTASSDNTTSLFKDATLDARQALQTSVWAVDKDYLPTLGIQLKAGRNFSEDMKTDSNAIIINEAAAAVLGYKDPVGKTLYSIQDGEKKLTQSLHIIGLIKNFNFKSLKQSVSPMILEAADEWYSLSVRVNSADITTTRAQIASKWSAFSPNVQFDYSYMDDDFNRLYFAEQRMGKISVAFTSLAIVVACLGLFGLAAYAAEQRTKEIGIRKVLVASLSTIVGMLTKDFLLLVLIAIVIASPLAWLFMNKWLQGFAYKTAISWWMLLAAGFGATLIAFATISFQSIKAALANPVKSLRSE